MNGFRVVVRVFLTGFQPVLPVFIRFDITYGRTVTHRNWNDALICARSVIMFPA